MHLIHIVLFKVLKDTLHTIFKTSVKLYNKITKKLNITIKTIST